MKKVITLLLILSVFLTSCFNGTSQDLKTLRKDNIEDATIIDQLNIDFDDKTGVSLYKEERTGKSYIDVYVAQDAADSLFVYNTNINSAITNRTKKFEINALTFSNSVYDDEKTLIVNEYNAAYGLSQLELGIELFSSFAWTTSLPASHLAKADAELTDDIYVSIAYLPTYVVRTYESNVILKAYVFIPVYAAFTCENVEIVSANNGYTTKEYSLSAINTVELLFDSTNTYLAKTVSNE